jgi:maltose alpha-D-glucosyltransferase/alpha-amylase
VVDMTASADRSLQKLRDRLAQLPPALHAAGREVVAARSAMVGHLEALRRIPRPGQRIRVHGDYHLGQVLRTEEDFVILDFEGDPTRTLAERRAKQSPLRDVAGMARSFSYAAHAALLSFTVHTAEDRRLLEPWADTWQYWATHAFLNGYRAAIKSPLLPDREGFEPLLRAFLLEKACRELDYELDHRPEWAGIPLRAILMITSRPA